MKFIRKRLLLQMFSQIKITFIKKFSSNKSRRRFEIFFNTNYTQIFQKVAWNSGGTPGFRPMSPCWPFAPVYTPLFNTPWVPFHLLSMLGDCSTLASAWCQYSRSLYLHAGSTLAESLQILRFNQMFAMRTNQRTFGSQLGSLVYPHLCNS